MSMPPTPSVNEWWSFRTTAVRPPSSASMNVASHSGRSRSRPAIPVFRAKSRTVSSVLGEAASNRRTCQDRSKSGSTTQRGVASRSGGCTTFCRKPGEIRVSRSSRTVNRSQSGARSSIRTTTTVDRSSGSCSMYQANALVSRMWTSTGSANATTSISSWADASHAVPAECSCPGCPRKCSTIDRSARDGSVGNKVALCHGSSAVAGRADCGQLVRSGHSRRPRSRRSLESAQKGVADGRSVRNRCRVHEPRRSVPRCPTTAQGKRAPPVAGDCRRWGRRSRDGAGRRVGLTTRPWLVLIA